MSVAVREFAEHGFHGARVERIARSAKCNARMLYHYYGSKEQLYLASLDSVFASIRNREAELNLTEGDPAAMARKLVEFTFDHFANNSNFVKLTRNENLLDGKFIRRSHMIRDMSQPLIASIAQLIERGHAQGVFSRKPDALNLYLTIVALSGHHLNNAATLGAVFGQDLTDPDWLAVRRAHAIDVILSYLGVRDG
ncbi:TetR family transcriptional regulator [Oceanicola sp. 22II-s10i]|nr:TetR family transcriptional regulator [Oceanicola sp. 22II-s10i]